MTSEKKINFIEKKFEVSIQELLYFIFIAIMFTVKGFGLYDGQLVYKILFIIAFMFWGLKLFLTDYTLKEWIMLIILGIVLLLMYRCNGAKGPLIVYAVLVGMKNVSLQKCMKIGAWSLGLSTLLLILYNLLILPDSNGCLVTERFGIQIGRWSLGYSHPNVTAVTYLALVTLVLFFLQENYNRYYFILLLLGDLIISFYCVSFTGFIVCMIYLCVAYFLPKLNIGRKFFRIVVSLYSLFCICIFMVVPFILPENIMVFLKNHVLTFYNRLILSKELFNSNNITLWGVHEADITTGVITLDNSYLYSIVFNGVIFSGIVFALYLYAIWTLVKQEKYVELLIVLALMAEGILEPFLFNNSFKNTSLFIIGAVIWEKIDQKTSRKKKFGLYYEKSIYIPAIFIPHEDMCLGKYWIKSYKRIILESIVFAVLLYFLRFYWLPEYVVNSIYSGIEKNIQFTIEYIRKILSWLIITEFFCFGRRLIRNTRINDVNVEKIQ